MMRLCFSASRASLRGPSCTYCALVRSHEAVFKIDSQFDSQGNEQWRTLADEIITDYSKNRTLYNLVDIGGHY
jgi:hypothetical protein